MAEKTAAEKTVKAEKAVKVEKPVKAEKVAKVEKPVKAEKPTKAGKAIKATRKRTRRAKYITIYSPFLMKETKHELIGEPIETEQGKLQWARCTKSRHSQLVNLDRVQQEQDKAKAIEHFTKEDAKQYSPKDFYNQGDVIFHKVWDDVGVVRSKDVSSSGRKCIIVEFMKCGEKRLIEDLTE